jgi:hypothetical protein
MAILQVVAVVVNNKSGVPAVLLRIEILSVGKSALKKKVFVPVTSPKTTLVVVLSLVLTMLFLKSTNQVPPLAVISPLVKMLPRLITSAFLVTDAELVGMYDV